jgi:hypothetical protein
MTSLREVNVEENKLTQLPYSLGLRAKTLNILIVNGNPLEAPMDELVKPLLTATASSSTNAEAGEEAPSPMRSLRRKASLKLERMRDSIKIKGRNEMEEASTAFSDLMKKMVISGKEQSATSSAWVAPERTPSVKKKGRTSSAKLIMSSFAAEAEVEGGTRDSGYAAEFNVQEGMFDENTLSEAQMAAATAAQRRRGTPLAWNEDDKGKRKSGPELRRRQTLGALSATASANASGNMVWYKREALRRLLYYLKDIWELTQMHSASANQGPRILNIVSPRESTIESEPSPTLGKTLLPEDDADNDNKQREKRRRIITEILETERTYVKELAGLDELYVKEAERTASLSPEDFRLAFGHVTTLTMFHKDHFLVALEEACKDDLLDARIGRVFVQHSAFIRMYSAYVNSVDAAMAEMEKWKTHKAKKAWRQLCDDARKNPKHTQLHLQGYLLLPVQRIPRYKMLLEQLLEKTTPTHADYHDLCTGLEEICKRAEEINERACAFPLSSSV